MTKASKKQINTIIDKTGKALITRLKRKGTKFFTTRHDGLGQITDEYNELIFAVQKNKKKRIKEEAMDVAIAAMWMVLSIEEGNK